MIEDKFKENIGLIGTQLRRFGLTHDPDAISLAYEALYNAILTYDSDRNVKFSTYATVCIYNRLGSLVRSMKTQLNTSITSYEAPLDDNGLTLIDVLESPLMADKEVLVECGVTTINNAVTECLKSLTNKTHRNIVDAWIQSDYKMTHTEIADLLGCSQSYVTQVIKKFRNILKNKLGDE